MWRQRLAAPAGWDPRRPGPQGPARAPCSGRLCGCAVWRPVWGCEGSYFAPPAEAAAAFPNGGRPYRGKLPAGRQACGASAPALPPAGARGALPLPRAPPPGGTRDGRQGRQKSSFSFDSVQRRPADPIRRLRRSGRTPLLCRGAAWALQLGASALRTAARAFRRRGGAAFRLCGETPGCGARRRCGGCFSGKPRGRPPRSDPLPPGGGRLPAACRKRRHPPAAPPPWDGASPPGTRRDRRGRRKAPPRRGGGGAPAALRGRAPQGGAQSGRAGPRPALCAGRIRGQAPAGARDGLPEAQAVPAQSSGPPPARRGGALPGGRASPPGLRRRGSLPQPGAARRNPLAWPQPSGNPPRRPEAPSSAADRGFRRPRPARRGTWRPGGGQSPPQTRSCRRAAQNGAPAGAPGPCSLCHCAFS